MYDLIFHPDYTLARKVFVGQEILILWLVCKCVKSFKYANFPKNDAWQHNSKILNKIYSEVCTHCGTPCNHFY